MVRRGAVLDRIGEDGFTPLGAAAWRGHRTTAQLLLRAGADPAAWGHNGHPPLHLAALAGHAELVEDFLRLGSPIELLNRARETALDVAASFCLSRADVGPTPGSQNGVAVQGCGS
jgi:ankyrin repeat protein